MAEAATQRAPHRLHDQLGAADVRLRDRGPLFEETIVRAYLIRG